MARFIHADLDAFYASVEQLLDPSLRGIPMAVGSGVILAASYEARARGVRSGMPVGQALRLSPNLRLVPGTFERYTAHAERVVEIFHRFTPLVERISIDEAFLDVSGARRLFGDEETIAARLRAEVRAEVGLPISVGVASTKHLAKVASAMAKPDGLLAVPVGEERRFLHGLPVGVLWGVGPVTLRRLAEIGVRTVGEIAGVPPGQLEARVGEQAARHLRDLADNVDPREVETERSRRSIGAQNARPPTVDVDVLERDLRHLSERVGVRARKAELVGRTVTVTVRHRPSGYVSRSATLGDGIDADQAIFDVARPLMAAALATSDEPVTLVRVALGHLEALPVTQLELPFDDGAAQRPGSVRGVKARDLAVQLDAITARFGPSSVRRASDET